MEQFAFGCCRQIEESSIEKPQRTSADTKGRKRKKKRLKLAKRSQKPSQFMIIHNQSKFFLNWNMLGLIHMHTRTYLRTETFTNEIEKYINTRIDLRLTWFIFLLLSFLRLESFYAKFHWKDGICYVSGVAQYLILLFTPLKHCWDRQKSPLLDIWCHWSGLDLPLLFW